MKTRIISLMMAVALLLSCIPMTALAASTENGWDYQTEGSGNEIYAIVTGTSNSGNVTVPSKLGGYPVREIKEYAFYNNTTLGVVTIPDSVTKVGMFAFAGSKVTKVTFPNSITSMGESVFSGCTSLKEVNIPSKLKYVPTLFLNNTGITQIKIPEGVTDINQGAFSGSSIQKVQFPSTLTYIGASAFDGCSSLTTMYFPEGLDTISQQAFRNCSSLQVVTIPAKVRYLEDDAFLGCNSLKTIIAKTPKESGHYYYSKCLGYNSSKQVMTDAIIYCIFESNAWYYANDCGIKTESLDKAPKDPSEGFRIDDRAANTLTVKGKKVRVKYKKLRKKNQVIAAKKAMTVSNAKGSVSYTLASAKKGKKSFKKYFKVNKKTGKITVKKKLKKGTYKVNVNVYAAGNASYKPVTKTATVTVRVK